jgi:hypothetical protein
MAHDNDTQNIASGISRERMIALSGEARLRSWIIGQVNVMDASELAELAEFIKASGDKP